MKKQNKKQKKKQQNGSENKPTYCTRFVEINVYIELGLT